MSVDSMTGKVVLVTGAGQACGRVIAEDFAHRGASVVVNDIDGHAGEETVRRIHAAGGVATFVRADVSAEAEVAALVQAAVGTYGRLDVAVNNAGTEVPVAIADSDSADFAAVFAANLEGVRACMKHEIRAMRVSGGGAIVNMSSVTSDLTAVPLNGLYAATKGGVDALTKTAAIEVAKEGISINSLAFLAADVDNGMFQRFLASAGLPQEQVLSAIPIGRLLSAAELCAAVRYLSSDEARFAVGTTLVLDGGFTAIQGQRFGRSRRRRPAACRRSLANGGVCASAAWNWTACELRGRSETGSGPGRR
jgi:NAD(P)-dependent dehydrogenase (short-subunit alcohol dehydrogenase family)